MRFFKGEMAAANVDTAMDEENGNLRQRRKFIECAQDTFEQGRYFIYI